VRVRLPPRAPLQKPSKTCEYPRFSRVFLCPEAVSGSKVQVLAFSSMVLISCTKDNQKVTIGFPASPGSAPMRPHFPFSGFCAAPDAPRSRADRRRARSRRPPGRRLHHTALAPFAPSPRRLAPGFLPGAATGSCRPKPLPRTAPHPQRRARPIPRRCHGFGRGRALERIALRASCFAPSRAGGEFRASPFFGPAGG
jgi:hypothetical protein